MKLLYILVLWPYIEVSGGILPLGRGFGILTALQTIGESITNLTSVVSEIFLEKEKNKNEVNTTLPLDTYLNIVELVTKYGYNIEEHNVTTEDGYILTIHRIPHGRNNIGNGSVVFLMHGIIDSSDSWVLQGPDKALAYILADKGFDVWMGNARGNKHALSHTKLIANDSKFWQFTWDEIGLYDLPAMIDYILNVTQAQSLYYVGHSQGTTSFFVLCSLKPEYNEKIKLMFALAPVAFMSHVKSPIVRLFSPATKFLSFLTSGLNSNSPSTESFNKITTFVCSFLAKCDGILSLIIGNEYNLINDSLLPVIFSHMPSGSSTSQFVHFGQLVESGRFCRYDFGDLSNFEIYGQYDPPDYALGNITVPIAIYYSDNDWLSSELDVEMLKEKLPNVIGYNFIEFNHLDYLYAEKAKDFIYKIIVEQIDDFESNMTLSCIVN